MCPCRQYGLILQGPSPRSPASSAKEADASAWLLADREMQGKSSDLAQYCPIGTVQTHIPAKCHREFGYRIISSLVILPPVVLLFWLGELYFLSLLALLAAVMAWEWCSLVWSERSLTIRYLSAAAAALLVFAAAYGFQEMGTLLDIGVLLGLGAIPLIYAGTVRLLTGAWNVKLLSGLLIIFCPAFAIYWIREMPGIGFETALWLALSVIITDISAYAVGRSIGGPKICRRISPNKTFAGLGGGIAGSAGFGAVFASYFGQTPELVALAGGVIAIVAQVGDFAESALKRHFDVKDSGCLIPGHGGVFDRVDGQITVLPFAAALMFFSGESMLLWTWP